MRKLLTAALALALTTLIAAPAQAAPAAQAALPPEVTGTAWSLVSLQPAGGAAEDTTGGGITMEFGPENAAFGSGGCNNYRTTYTAGDAGALSFSMPAATLRLCEEPANQREQAFFVILSGVSSYSLADGQLTLTAADGGTLVFAPSAAAPAAPAEGSQPAQLPSTGAGESAALWLALAGAAIGGGLLARRSGLRARE